MPSGRARASRSRPRTNVRSRFASMPTSWTTSGTPARGIRPESTKCCAPTCRPTRASLDRAAKRQAVDARRDWGSSKTWKRRSSSFDRLPRISGIKAPNRHRLMRRPDLVQIRPDCSPPSRHHVARHDSFAALRSLADDGARFHRMHKPANSAARNACRAVRCARRPSYG